MNKPKRRRRPAPPSKALLYFPIAISVLVTPTRMPQPLPPTPPPVVKAAPEKVYAPVEKVDVLRAAKWASVRGDLTKTFTDFRLAGRKLVVGLSLAPSDQAKAEAIVKKYDGRFAAVAAIDATTGRVLALAAHSRKPRRPGNAALQADFPAASVFKLVTAAAAVEKQNLAADSAISFSGNYHDLFRYTLSTKAKTMARQSLSLKHAFAHSVNPVFAKLAVGLEEGVLEDYARRFQFNTPIAADFPIEEGVFELPRRSEWGIAQAGSGYNWSVQMSPLQGALMAAAVANDGTMMEPFLVENLRNEAGDVVYRAQPRALLQALRPGSAAVMRDLMRETVESGTSRSSFGDLKKKKNLRLIEIGGKTGTLSAVAPSGKCDWFVGYARLGDRKLAFAVLTVHSGGPRAKSAFLARSLLENHFDID